MLTFWSTPQTPLTTHKSKTEGTADSSLYFDRLCDLISEAINSVPSKKVIKTFKQTLLSLPIDGSRDEVEGSKRLLKYIAEAPSLEEIPGKYRSHVTYMRVLSMFVKLRLMLTELEGEVLVQLESTKIVLSNTSFAVGLIQKNISRKRKSMRRNVQLLGSSKIGNHKNLKH